MRTEQDQFLQWLREDESRHRLQQAARQAEIAARRRARMPAVQAAAKAAREHVKAVERGLYEKDAPMRARVREQIVTRLRTLEADLWMRVAHGDATARALLEQTLALHQRVHDPSLPFVVEIPLALRGRVTIAATPGVHTPKRD